MMTSADIARLPPERIEAIYTRAANAALRAIATWSAPPELENAPRVAASIGSTLRTARDLYHQALGAWAAGRRAEAASAMLVICDSLLRSRAIWEEFADEYPRLLQWVDSSPYRDAVYKLVEATGELVAATAEGVREVAEGAAFGAGAVLGLVVLGALLLRGRR